MDGQRDVLDWADVELNMSLHDGMDGSMTSYTERPYTDGSMTPLTEASWMDESLTPSSCPGTPDAAFDLPLLQPAALDRMSASGHVWLGRVPVPPVLAPPTSLSRLRRNALWLVMCAVSLLIYTSRLALPGAVSQIFTHANG